jgi:hypothetical protein
MNNLPIDELLNKAFSLACFILGDREHALRTIEEAMARLDVTTAAQGKRLYYKPSAFSGRSREAADRYRNKVLFSELHLLQRLVYIASEPYEERKEQSMVANEGGIEEMLIHFIKHLVRITTRRNSFYVTLGISRLLYNYTTAETMEVYNAVIQDPERVKDDYYYRSRKGVLMQELKKRFGSLIEIGRGPRGEERFHASEEPNRFIELVKDSLTFFTPWYTNCLVPAGVNPIMDGIAGLSSHGPQGEDKIEVDRIHAVLHPDCHGRLIKSLGFEEPERRLEIPRFFFSKADGSGDGTGRGRRHQSGLSHNELDEIKNHLDDQSSRRKRAFAGLLRVVVDGDERARLDLSRSSRASFALDPDAELLEVRAMVNGTDLLLASHLFTHREPEDLTASASIVLEGGQQVAIKVSPASGQADAIVDVAYRETNLFRAASLYLKQLTHSSSDEPSMSRTRSLVRVPALALAFALLALCAVGVVQFLRHRNPASESLTGNRQHNQPGEVAPPVKNNGQTSSGAVPDSPLASTAPVDKNKGEQKRVEPGKNASSNRSPSPEVARANELQQPEQPTQRSPKERVQREAVIPLTPESNATRKPSPERRAPESETTRTLPDEMAAVPLSEAKKIYDVPLSEVKKIYVEVVGDAALKESVRVKTIESLNATRRFISAVSKDEADALLRVTVRSASTQAAQVSASALLINARGETIWRGAGESGVYTGSNESVADGIVKELLGVASKSKRQH